MSLVLAVLTLFAAFTAAQAEAETEPQAITIHIPGGHKRVVSALFVAVDEGTPVTGIAELDSLAATYGLIGIYRTNRHSSGFYGYRFRLTFPPGADVAAIAGAYGTYTEKMDIQRSMRVDRVENPIIRVAKKLGAGVLGGSFGVLVVFVIGESADSDADPIAAVAAGPHIALIGYTLGSPIGVSWVDSRDKGILTWGGSVAGWLVGRMGVKRDYWPLIYSPLIGATIASELWRKPPQDSQNSRVSVRLGAAPNGGLSAVATLRF